jgi:CheY-like chemotaxis protein
VRQQVEAKGLKLECDLPPAPVTVDADPQRLTQILQNLVRNAVVYTAAGSIAVTVRGDETATRICVRDTGIGIDPKDAADLFAPYRQGNDNGESGGLGLGLAVVKALVEAHGGTVAVRSEGPGTGSEFSVAIPRLPSVAPDLADQQKPLDSRRILVVDDQHDVANSLAAQLEDLGQEVEVAYSAADGLSKARLRKPQMAFVDLSMPETSGTQLARQLRKEFAGEGLTLVAMTGHGATYAAARTESFDHTLLKPVTTQKLRHVLNGQDSDHHPER